MICDLCSHETCIEHIQWTHACHNYITFLPYDIINYISQYLHHIRGHVINYTVKIIDDKEDLGYDFIYMSKKICTICFKSAISACLKQTNQLPYLRRHIHYFDTLYMYKDNIDTLDNVFLPYIYNIDLYREKNVICLNNKYSIITSI